MPLKRAPGKFKGEVPKHLESQSKVEKDPPVSYLWCGLLLIEWIITGYIESLQKFLRGCSILD